MRYCHLLGLMLFCCYTLSVANAADDPPKILVAHGMIEKVEKDEITVKPRSADGKFGKTLALKTTGTSNFSAVSLQKRGDKNVLVQKVIEGKSLTTKHQIAVIYAENGEGELVVLSAVTREE